MLPIQRLAPTGVAVLLALSLSACSGAPTDASKTEFCATANDRSWLDELGEKPDAEAMLDGLQSWGSDLEEVGTPEGIPDDAREGFDITVDYVGELEADDFEDAGGVDPAENLSEDDQGKVEAFDAYVATTCVPDSTSVDVPEPSIS